MECILGNDFECMYDDRLERRLKRKHALKGNSLKHSLKRTLEEQQLGGGIVDEDYMLFLNHVGDCLESTHSTRKDDDDNGEDDFDPHYKMFLEKLREDGKSYVLKVAINNDVSLTLKYEADCSSDDDLESPTIRELRNVVDTESLEASKDLRKEPQNDPMNVVGVDTMDSANDTTNCTGSETTDSMVKDMTPEPVNHVSGKEIGVSSKKSHRKGSQSFELDGEHIMEVDMVDECYQIYLNVIKGEDECTVSTIDDGQRVKYEQIDGESSSDSEVLVAYNAPDFHEGNHTPFVTIGEDDQQCLGNSNTSNHSRFREKLMDKLRESYDHEEYKKLWQDITERKPKERCFHFRSGVLKSVKKINELGPSYLDQHPVLELKINAVLFDQFKVLNLLRGFFFWLQNLVQKGAFFPWLDPLCLEVMPRNSAEDSASSEPSRTPGRRRKALSRYYD